MEGGGSHKHEFQVPGLAVQMMIKLNNYNPTTKLALARHGYKCNPSKPS
jgi:hypothetical protein